MTEEIKRGISTTHENTPSPGLFVNTWLVVGGAVCEVMGLAGCGAVWRLSC